MANGLPTNCIQVLGNAADAWHEASFFTA